MTKEIFKQRLKALGMTQVDFAKRSDTPYDTVNNWNGRSRPVPTWVDSWLQNYEKAQGMEQVAVAVAPFISGDGSNK